MEYCSRRGGGGGEGCARLSAPPVVLVLALPQALLLSLVGSTLG